jgi:hypothetical protein
MARSHTTVDQTPPNLKATTTTSYYMTTTNKRRDSTSLSIQEASQQSLQQGIDTPRVSTLSAPAGIAKLGFHPMVPDTREGGGTAQTPTYQIYSNKYTILIKFT